ncbi:hypothetical protein [Porticoccus sp.]|uniref:hypothetical protein n=1 Tax=Porticoccus sp. TaxID=2024853 RepID=UPI003F6A0327
MICSREVHFHEEGSTIPSGPKDPLGRTGFSVLSNKIPGETGLIPLTLSVWQAGNTDIANA